MSLSLTYGPHMRMNDSRLVHIRISPFLVLAVFASGGVRRLLSSFSLSSPIGTVNPLPLPLHLSLCVLVFLLAYKSKL